MALFKFIPNGVILEFKEMVDIRGLRQHPEYIEVNEKGKEIGAPKSDTRPEWDIPMRAYGSKPSIK